VRRPAQAGLVLEIDAGEGPLGGTEMDIAQLIYRPMEPLGAFKDFEFSRATMAARRRQGLSDVLIALQASPWLAPMPKELGVRVFDVMHDILTGRPEHV
jgi:NTE family protein